jgi:hypothetical protein
MAWRWISSVWLSGVQVIPDIPQRLRQPARDAEALLQLGGQAPAKPIYAREAERLEVLTTGASLFR